MDEYWIHLRRSKPALDRVGSILYSERLNLLNSLASTGFNANSAQNLANIQKSIEAWSHVMAQFNESKD